MANKRKTMTYRDFSGGWNADASPDALADNECEVFDNIDTSIVKAVKKRAGCSALNATAFTSDCTKIIEWNRKDGTVLYLGIIGNNLVKFDSSWVPTTVKALSSPDIGHFFFQDAFWFTGKEDGIDKFWKYYGSKKVIALTVVGTITLAGNAYLSFTFTGSSYTYAVPVALNDTASQVAVKVRAFINSSDMGDLYVASGDDAEIIITSLTEIADDASFAVKLKNDPDEGGCTGLTEANSSNVTSGEALAAVLVTPTSDESNDLTPIKRCRSFVWNPKNSRIFATVDPLDVSCVYYSEANDPAFFKNTSKVYPTQGEGASLGVTSFSNGVIVEFKAALWAWIGYDPASDAEWYRLPVVHGCSAHGSVCQTPNSLTMVGIGGLYALSPGVLDKDLMLINASEMSVNLSKNKVSSVLKDASHISTMISCYQNTKQRYLLAYGDDSSNPKNNRILVYDFNLNCFARFTGIQADYFCSCDNGDILIASGTYILKMEQGLDDVDITDGSDKAVKVELRSRGFDFNLPFVMKKLKKLFLASYQFKNTDTTISIGLKGGYRSLYLHQVPLDESLVWGDNWGSIWGYTDIITKEFRFSMKASRFQLVITHEVVGEDLLIYGVAFEYKTKKMKGVKYNGSASKDVLS